MTNQRQPVKDYYEILGVARDASLKEIRAAYRRLSRKYHPDHNHEEGAEHRFMEIKDAYEVVGFKGEKDGKRFRYDQKLRQAEARRRQEAAGVYPWGEVDKTIATLDNFFEAAVEGMMRGDTGRTTAGARSTSRPRKAPEIKKVGKDELMMTETDLGLLQALVEAGRSETDGKWVVSRSEKDKRANLPEGVYAVTKQEGNVKISRTLVDWMRESQVGGGVRIMSRQSPLSVLRVDDETTFISEDSIRGKGPEMIDRGHQFLPVHFGPFLDGMKSLADLIASGGLTEDSNLRKAVRDINFYSEVRIKRRSVAGTPEPVITISFDEVGTRLKEAELRVRQVEGGVRAPEGQVAVKDSEFKA